MDWDGDDLETSHGDMDWDGDQSSGGAQGWVLGINIHPHAAAYPVTRWSEYILTYTKYRMCITNV